MSHDYIESGFLMTYQSRSTFKHDEMWNLDGKTGEVHYLAPATIMGYVTILLYVTR